MKVIKYLSQTLVSFSLVIQVQAYTTNKMDNGSLVKWGTDRPELLVHRNSSATISGQDIESAVEDITLQWAQASSSLSIETNYTESSSPRSGVNDLYFSSDSSLLGPSVAGVTVTTTNQSTGELIEADIVINDDLPPSNDPDSKNYIGDIIAHELGHYLGLAHSEVQFASMFYRLSRGQHKIDADDQAGVRAVYSPESFASLSGRVVGGEDLTGVFGAHVQAFSLTSGEVAGSAVADTQGNFEIEGLTGDDKYYLYIDRLKSPDNLPLRYRGVKDDFCYSGRSYRGSFFQSCYTRDEGRPQAVYVSAGQKVSVGEVTIRCGLETPVDYMQAKNSQPLYLNIKESRSEEVYIGESLVGFFAQGDVEDRIGDEFSFEVDIDDLPVQTGNEKFYVEVKSFSQSLNSPIRISMEMENLNLETRVSQPAVEIEERLDDGTFNLENTLRMPISIVDPNANTFDLKLIPEALESYSLRTDIPLNQLIPDYEIFSDPLNFYFLSIHIVQEVNGLYSHVSSENGDDVTSNKFCPAAPRTYSVDQTRTLASQLGRNSSSVSSAPAELNALGCGMILLDSKGGPPGPGPGPGVLVLTFFCLSLILANVASRRLRNSHF